MTVIPTANREWMRPDEACEYLSISRRALSEWQKRRIVPFARMGRKCVLFRKTDLDKAIARFTVQAVGGGA